MSQPTPYNRVFSFTSFETSAPGTPMTSTTAALVPANLAAKPVFFASKSSGDQGSITSGTDVKITFPAVDIDVGTFFANSTYSPTVPGKYRLSAAVVFWTTNAVDAEGLTIHIFKNGVLHRSFLARRSGASSQSVMISAVVENDGNDTFEVFVTKAGAGTGTIVAGVNTTWFCGEMV